MKTIHKKLIPSQHGYHLMVLPVGSKILSVGSSGAGGSVPIYVQLENTETDMRQIEVFVASTNLMCPENGTYIGTCTLDAQSACHVFTF